ncbi:sulfurtransferase complex subunit TusD [Gayadomonas joobiniege]|uniref:sulfurtransferase complex subunit TusD n=1 Tax=Gayadomonas joobiniege TaxID=1234606 RepID=UPI0003825E30|nr:sulfurtransferase complex subunit TusD [Gayadomonas joobiniege]
MQNIILFVTSSPDSYMGKTAYKQAKMFAHSANECNLLAVFFYGDGVLAANQLRTPPADEFDVTQHWQTFSQEYKIPLILCSAAAQRRGVLNADEANYHGKLGNNLAPGFQIGGLAEYVELQANANKVIQY